MMRPDTTHLWYWGESLLKLSKSCNPKIDWRIQLIFLLVENGHVSSTPRYAIARCDWTLSFAATQNWIPITRFCVVTICITRSATEFWAGPVALKLLKNTNNLLAFENGHVPPTPKIRHGKVWLNSQLRYQSWRSMVRFYVLSIPVQHMNHRHNHGSEFTKLNFRERSWMLSRTHASLNWQPQGAAWQGRTPDFDATP